MLASAKLQQPICIARIGAAHGVRGECRVKPFTVVPEAVGDYGPLTNVDGSLTLTVKRLRIIKNGMLVVKFEEVIDRNRAEDLNGTDLYIDRAALGDTDEADEFFAADLIGLTVIDQSGVDLGTVTAINDFGAGDLLEIALKTGGSALLPFTLVFVPKIDFETEAITITPPDGWDEG